jgi:hypothetical protein
MSDYVFVRTLTKESIGRSLQDIFDEFVIELCGEFKVTLDSPLFEWNRVTYRKNGEVVGSIRNAVDTGNLRDSIDWTPLRPGVTEIEWKADYAQDVFSHAMVDLVAVTLERFKL